MDDLSVLRERSTRWALFSKTISQFLTFGSTILLARLLSINDFGQAALALIVYLLIDNFVDSGFVYSIVQNKDFTTTDSATCYWFLTFLSSVVVIGVVCLSPRIADLLGDREAWRLIAAQSIAFLAVPAQVVCTGILLRAVRLDTIARIEIIVATLRVGISLIMAIVGFGVWSLVLPLVAARFMTMVGVFIRSQWKPSLNFSLLSLRQLVPYGTHVTGSRLIWYLYARADRFITGTIIGTEALGVYSMGQQFANALPDMVSASVNRAAFPVFSQLRSDASKLRSEYIDTLRTTTAVCFPALAGLAVVAPSLVSVALGPRWAQAAFPIQCLAGVAALQIVFNLSAVLINAIGRASFNMYYNCACFVVLSVGLVVGARTYSMLGVLMAWFVCYIPLTVIMVWAAGRFVGLPLLSAGRAMGIGTAAALTVIAASWLSRMLPFEVSSGVALAVQILVCVSFWVIALYVMDRQLLARVLIPLRSCLPKTAMTLR